MKPIREWSIESKVDACRYWPGGEIAVAPWEQCATGVGHTEREALDDALNCLAQGELPQGLLGEVSKASERTVCDMIDCPQRDTPQAADPCINCDWYWYVTVLVK